MPGAPLEIRWSLKPGDNWAVTATALTSKIWLIKQDATASGRRRRSADIGDPSKIPLPVDISITADGKGLWVNTFMDGKTRYFDLSDPEHPKQTYEKVTGKQVNMVSQSWDGKRVYITSSLLANWDKTGENDEQFLRAFNWDGKELTPAFEVDFYKEKLGRAHHMKFGTNAIKAAYENADEHARSARVAARALAAAAALLAPPPAAAHEAPNVPADFDPPAPGTLSPGADHARAATATSSTRAASAEQLAGYTHGKVTLLSLMYTSCSDEKGCPMAFYTIDMIKRDLEKSQAARGRVRVVSLSFDPQHDTPEVMRAYGGDHVKGGSPVPWYFLTTTSKRELAPMLDGFGQDVSKAGADAERPGAEARAQAVPDRQGRLGARDLHHLVSRAAGGGERHQDAADRRRREVN